MRTTNSAALIMILLLVFWPSICPAGMNVTTDAKLFRLELEPDPVSPIVGTNAAVLTVTDARSNRAVDEAVIEIAPWMTVHGHGSPKKPSIKGMGSGRYRVENIFYTMEGDWDLLVTVRKGDSLDMATLMIRNVRKR